MSDKVRFVSRDDFSKAIAVDAPKGGADGMALIKSYPAEVKTEDKKERRIEFSISTSDVDRENDVVNQDGWDLNNYLKNPVVLFAHDHWTPPVGRGLNVRLENGKLKSTAEFTPQDLNPFGYMIFRMYDEGFMRAVSVGFIPKEYAFDNDRKYGINYYKQELLEYSAVPVPANPHAVMEARSAGIDVTPLKSWAERTLDMIQKGSPDSEMARRHLETLRNISDPTGRPLVIALGNMRMPGTVQLLETPEAILPLADAAKLLQKEEPVSKKAEEPPASSGRAKKSVEIYECGVKECNAFHVDESDATLCADVHDTEGKATTLVTLMATLTESLKSGARTLADATAGQVRSAVASLQEVLTPQQKGEESKDPVELAIEFEDEPAAEEVLRGVAPSDLTDLIAGTVRDAIATASGRVD